MGFNLPIDANVVKFEGTNTTPTEEEQPVYEATGGDDAKKLVRTDAAGKISPSLLGAGSGVTGSGVSGDFAIWDSASSITNTLNGVTLTTKTNNIGFNTTTPENFLGVAHGGKGINIKSDVGAIFVIEGTSASFYLGDNNAGANSKAFLIQNSGGQTKFASLNDALTINKDNIMFFDHVSARIGISNNTPQTIASFTTSGLGINIKPSSGISFLAIEGDFPALYLVDSAGAVNDKVAKLTVDAGIIKFNTITDAGFTNIDNILVMDIGTGDVGIGVTPLNRLHIVDSTDDDIVRIVHTGAAAGGLHGGAGVLQIQDDGTAMQTDENLGHIFFGGHNGVGVIDHRAGIVARAASNWSGTDVGSYLIFMTTKVGDATLTETERVRIADNGFVGINGIPAARLDVKGFSTGDIAAGEYDALFGDAAGDNGAIIKVGGTLIAHGGGFVSGLNFTNSVVIQNLNAPTEDTEFAFISSSGAIRFAIPKEGPGLGTYFPRSVIIAGPAIFSDDIYTPTHWGFDLAMDTTGVGADLGVQNNLQVLNESWLMSNVGIGHNAPTETLHVVGHTLMDHTGDQDGDHALEIIVRSNGFADVQGIDIDYITNAIGIGDEEDAIIINIDQILATGGDVQAIEVLATEGGADITALEAGARVNPIKQRSGVFADMDSALVLAVDRLTEFTTVGVDIAMFVADNDTVTIGNADKFEQIEWIFDTVASGAGIKPTFRFSTGVGTWTSFVPTDGTNGMRNNGGIAWDNLNIPTWAPGTGSEYLIEVTRTRNSLSVVPIESLVQIAVTVDYGWNKDGDVLIRNLGAGTTEPENLIGVAHGARTVNVNNDNGSSLLIAEGSGIAALFLADSGSGANLKAAGFVNSLGTTVFRSLNDADLSVNVDNILVLDHAIGNVGIGTVPDSDAELHIVSSGVTRIRVERASISEVELYCSSSDNYVGTVDNHGSTVRGRFAIRYANISNVSTIGIQLMETGRTGLGTVVPLGQCHIDQSSLTAAIPVLYLDQADLSEELIEFNTTIGVGNPIEAIAGKTYTTTHLLRVTIPGALTRYIPCGTLV